jgi:hypothetical protein
MIVFNLIIFTSIILSQYSVSSFHIKQNTVLSNKNKNDINKNNRLEYSSALLVTNADTISLIYPKEMNYEDDYLHIIFKFNSSVSFNQYLPQQYRIEDSVFDNRTWSIYFILSNLTGGSEILRLKRLNKPVNFTNSLNSNNFNKEYSYQVASNWILSVVYKNASSKILSLDINVNKRKFYWFEFNKYTQTYSINSIKLNNNNNQKNQKQISIALDKEIGEQFSEDGYSYIAILKDNDNYNVNNDIVLFISNNETLILCHLLNMTCLDYLRYMNPNNHQNYEQDSLLEQNNQINSDEDGDYIYEDDFSMSGKTAATTASTLSTTSNKETKSFDKLGEPIISYGKLMGIKYYPMQNSLIVCDYLNDQIDRLNFQDSINYRLDRVETLLKLDYLRKSASHKQDDNLRLLTMNPIMSVFNDNYLYWIDYEEGLKVNDYKTTIFRTIYKIKEPISLKLLHLTTPKFIYEPNEDTGTKVSNSNSNNKNLTSFFKTNTRFKYPPDYFYYLKYLKEEELNEEEQSLVRSSAFKFQFSKKDKNVTTGATFISNNKSKYLVNFISLLFFSYFLA